MKNFLTDLIGIRCFILFKADWKKFHAYLEEKIEDNPQYYLDDCLKDFDEDTEHTYMAEMPKVIFEMVMHERYMKLCFR